MVYLRKERSPTGPYNKLKQKKFESCRIIKMVGPNAHPFELPDGFSISAVFNVSAYYGSTDKISQDPNEFLVKTTNSSRPMIDALYVRNS